MKKKQKTRKDDPDKRKKEQILRPCPALIRVREFFAFFFGAAALRGAGLRMIFAMIGIY